MNSAEGATRDSSNWSALPGWNDWNANNRLQAWKFDRSFGSASGIGELLSAILGFGWTSFFFRFPSAAEN